jgi:hypothetical protein
MDATVTPRTPRARPSTSEIVASLRERLAVPKYSAGKALGWGKRSTDQAVAMGLMPVIPGPGFKAMVPSIWVLKQLQIED